MKICWVLILLIFSCSNKQINLRNTKWQLKKLTIDDRNNLKPFEIKAINQYIQYIDTLKMYTEFKDTSVFVYVENSEIDTSSYKIVNDTLFYLHRDNLNDTDIIVKISGDNLIMRSLSGSRTYSVRVR